MTSENRIENERAWRQRVARAGAYRGNIKDFCQSEGISREGLRYWQKKISAKGSRPVRVPAVSRFVGVEIVDPIPVVARLPDASWVAELILSLHCGGER